MSSKNLTKKFCKFSLTGFHGSNILADLRQNFSSSRKTVGENMESLTETSFQASPELDKKIGTLGKYFPKVPMKVK
jgi:hypothetical protein